MPGHPAKEGNAIVGSDKHPRAASEEAAGAAAADGVNVSVVRLPQVHDPVAQGLITPAIAMYREKGVCAYIGEGRNRWPAAYVLDVAHLYRLAIEKAEPNAKYHAVAEEGVPMRDIAEAIGRRLKLPAKSIAPEEAQAYWLARHVRWARCARLQRADAKKAGVGTDWTRLDRRPRTAASVGSLKHARQNLNCFVTTAARNDQGSIRNEISFRQDAAQQLNREPRPCFRRCAPHPT